MSSRPGAARTVLVLLVGSVLLGVVAGVCWLWWWTPPDGLAYQGQWYLDPPGPDVSFAATATYVVIAAELGLALGVVAAVLGRDVVVTGAALLGASLLAGGVMFAVGHTLGPDDPHQAARSAADFDKIPADLSFGTDADESDWASSALVTFPSASMFALATIYLVWQPDSRRARTAAPAAGESTGETASAVSD